MVIRNQIASLIYRILLLGLGIATLTILGIQDSVVSPLNTFRNYASILTLLSTILVLIEIIVNSISLGKGVHRMASGVYPAITFICLSLELGLMFGHALYCSFTNMSFFGIGLDLAYPLLSIVLFPLAYFADWLFFGEKGTVKKFHLISVTSLPLLYYLFSYLNHLIRGETFSYATAVFDPKTFANNALLSGNNGWNGVATACISLLAIYITTGALLLLLSSFLAGKLSHKN